MRPIRNRVAKFVAIAAFAVTLLASQGSPAQAWGECAQARPAIEVLSVDDGGVIRP